MMRAIQFLLICAAFFAGQAQGQFAPFGFWKSAAAPAWAPTALDSIRLWLDASAVTGKSDGDTLYAWLDQSGKGYHAYQLTGAKKPVYKTNILNGRPTIRFDGSDDHFNAGRVMPLLGTGRTVFAVSRRTGGTTSHSIIAKSDATGTAYRWGLLYISGAIYGVADTRLPTVARTTTYPEIVSYYVKTTADSMRIYSQDTLICSLNQSVSDNWSERECSLFIGAYNAESSSGKCDEAFGSWQASGDIYEIIVYDRAMYPAEMKKVIDYLKTKYGL